MKSSLLLFSSILLTQAIGRELTIQVAPFETTLELEATFIPAETTPFKVDAKQWSQFEIAELVDHGTVVKKGQVLLSFEVEKYQRQLAESKEAAKGRKISLARNERELADLKKSTPSSLEGLKLAHDRAKESLDYFTKTGRALDEQSARESLARATRTLSYQEEELKQLLKMYEEDGITEETEEIILKRQKSAVESAKFSLKRTEQSTKWSLEKSIPRQAVDLKRTYEAARLAYETGKVNLPRALEEKTLAVAKAKRANAKADQDLAEFIADGKFMVLKSPADGVIYHGEIDDSSWSLGTTAKFLFKGGNAPTKTVLMSLVPTGAPLTLQGSVAQAERLKLPADAKGTASVAGLDKLTFPVNLTGLDLAPNASGRYDLSLGLTLPQDTAIVTGMKGKAKLITYRNEAAIKVPSAAVTTKDGKSTVKVKMADGKNETREVETGRAMGDQIEITKGLEADQVILVPEPKS